MSKPDDKDADLKNPPALPTATSTAAATAAAAAIAPGENETAQSVTKETHDRKEANNDPLNTKSRKVNRNRDDRLRNCFDITELKDGKFQIACKYCSDYRRIYTQFHAPKAREHITKCPGAPDDLVLSLLAGVAKNDNDEAFISTENAPRKRKANDDSEIFCRGVTARDPRLRNCFEITLLEDGRSQIVCKYCDDYDRIFGKFHAPKARDHLTKVCPGVDDDLRMLLLMSSNKAKKAKQLLDPSYSNRTTGVNIKQRQDMIRQCFRITPVDGGDLRIACKYCKGYNIIRKGYNATQARKHAEQCPGVDEDIRNIIVQSHPPVKANRSVNGANTAGRLSAELNHDNRKSSRETMSPAIPTFSNAMPEQDARTIEDNMNLEELMTTLKPLARTLVQHPQQSHYMNLISGIRVLAEGSLHASRLSQRAPVTKLKESAESIDDPNNVNEENAGSDKDEACDETNSLSNNVDQSSKTNEVSSEGKVEETKNDKSTYVYC